MTNALVLKVPGISTNPNLPNYKDPTIVDGVKFLFDLASQLSWPSLAAPANGAAVKDIAGGADGSVALVAGQAITYAGGGFDFSAISLVPDVVKAPSGCLQSIHAADNDYFMVAFYAKMPLLGEWNVAASISPMFSCTDGVNGYATPEADLVTISQWYNSGKFLNARRQTNGSTANDAISISPVLHHGLVTQVAYWRNASGCGLRMKSSGGTTLGTGPVGSNNTGDFSSKRPRWGICDSFNNPSNHGAGPWHWRLYRGWLEDLSITDRDPVTVLDADYARTIARNVFS